LMLAHLHPALALALVVPFLPAPQRDMGMFVDEDEYDRMGEELAKDLHVSHSALHMYEHQTKLFVDFGLFFFAFANAGVQFAAMGALTWLILGALVVGKTVGISLLGLIGIRMGFPLPDGMNVRDLFMAGFVAALGLTVALFVASAAFVDPLLQGQAKMGALFSGFVGIAALGLGRSLGLGREAEGAEREASAAGGGQHDVTPAPAQASPRD